MANTTVLQPKDKSDSKWLRDAGYSGMPQFMISYGLKFPDEIDEAKRLIDEFRGEQQQEWEAQNSNFMLIIFLPDKLTNRYREGEDRSKAYRSSDVMA